MENIAVNLIIEKEDNLFIASSPDVNVFAEGETIDEAKDKFMKGINLHFENFPEEREKLIVGNCIEMPMIQKVLLPC